MRWEQVEFQGYVTLFKQLLSSLVLTSVQEVIQGGTAWEKKVTSVHFTTLTTCDEHMVALTC